MRIKPIILLAFLAFIIACNMGSSGKKQKLVGEVWSVNEDGDSVLSRYDEKSRLLSFTTYKNGYKNGVAKKFYENGKEEFVIRYKDGYKNGTTYWYYQTGNLYRETNYKTDQKDGMQKRYYKTGQLQAEVPYEMNEVQPGVKEYTKSGKLMTNYPEIIIEPVDRLSFENRYTLKCYLSNGSKKVKFYRVDRYKGNFFKESMENNNGIGMYHYHVSKGGYVMEKITIRAEYKTSLTTPYVIEKKYNVAIDY